MSSKHPTYLLAVHGGAGTIGRHQADESPYHDGLALALGAGEAVLAAGGAALDAVIAAVVSLEDNPLFNAGRGSVYTADETHESDASVMDGSTLAAGAVAVVRGVKNPVRLARAVMGSGSVLLVGEGAERFAGEQGFERMSESYFHTDARLAQLRRVKQGTQAHMAGVLDHTAAADSPPLDEERKLGTVGAVARDRRGNLASAVSTGGLTNKRPGRVGDTPVIGAGIYANNATCAVAATGTGEHFLRACIAHDIHARMAYGGATLQDAAEAAVGELRAIGGEGGVVAVGHNGELALPFNSVGMYRGWLREGEAANTRVFA